MINALNQFVDTAYHRHQWIKTTLGGAITWVNDLACLSIPVVSVRILWLLEWWLLLWQWGLVANYGDIFCWLVWQFVLHASSVTLICDQTAQVVVFVMIQVSVIVSWFVISAKQMTHSLSYLIAILYRSHIRPHSLYYQCRSSLYLKRMNDVIEISPNNK